MTEYLTIQQTERLVVRPLSILDVSAWRDFLGNTDATRHFPKEMQTPDFSEDWINKQLNRYKVDGMGLMALEDKLTGKLIGQCGLLHQTVDEFPEIEIGYHILPEFWGNGYATEAAKFFKELAFNSGISNSVISIIHPENVPSQMVASKNGMTKEKTTIHNGMKAYVFRAIRM